MEYKVIPWKFKWCRLILIVTMVVLSLRLWDLQVMRGGEMRRLSEQNRIRVKKVIAPRGVIFDKSGRVLADTRPSFNLYITPEDIKDFSQTVDGLAKLLNIDREDILEKLKMASGFPPSFPVKIKPDVTKDELAKVEAHRVYIPGVSIQIEPKRNYPYGKMMAHMLGYVSEISSEELKIKENKSYSPGDYIGKYGLEKTYEGYLRGVDGEKRVEVDAMGREVRTLDVIDSIPGNSLYLNVNLDVQQVVENALENKKGGIIVLDPKTGAVIALVSRPAFDPNKFTSGISKQDLKAINADPGKPLMNKAIQGGYPPGSTFKMVPALKALDLGIVNDKTGFSCRGSFSFGNHSFACWKKGGHGSVSVHKAIVQSCDVYFYNVGLKLGVDRIHEMCEAIGLGPKTGIDLPGEIRGLVPSTEWKRKTYKQPWYEGETVSVAIGQGAVWLTPIHLVQLSAFIANEGVTFKPQIVNRVVSPEGKTVKTFEPVMKANVKMKKDTFARVREGMKGVVNEPGGTAYSSRVQNINMSGKTGTAQAGSLEKGKHLGDHAWFIAYAPAEDPTVAISVLVEKGGHGGSESAPIAKAITQTIFKANTGAKEAQTNENR
ncbi:MAG: penicillin-binding protein 2 [Syntrophus sp. (in: bacteria)]|nr:penicillin-binding protein 2 [Syntrophus sp. (in: bacteria)]